VRPYGVLETCLYARDLEAAERFFADVLGLEVYAHADGRHVFFRCGAGMFLVFNPDVTEAQSVEVAGKRLPLPGARGAGHMAFAVREADLPAWRERLRQAGVTIERELTWPQGGHSIYFRDPAGNSVELATPRLWALPEPPVP
jgi:catechol 2,3-dioxygenase-like lactoylglutathione lyase family enzyme